MKVMHDRTETVRRDFADYRKHNMQLARNATTRTTILGAAARRQGSCAKEGRHRGDQVEGSSNGGTAGTAPEARHLQELCEDPQRTQQPMGGTTAGDGHRHARAHHAECPVPAG
eukprot:4934011-Pyramimonas_sp.AAC.1